MSDAAPQPRDRDRLLKRLWLVNGFLIFALILLLGGTVLVDVLDPFGRDPDAAIAATAPPPDEVDVQPRAVRLEMPTRVRGTDTRLVLVRHGSGYVEPAVYGLASGVGDGAGPIVNVVFLASTGGGHLLFDRPAYVRTVSYPGGRSWPETDSTQTWITYEAALDDTDGDGRLSRHDRIDLFVSDLDGSNLRRVLSEPWRYREHSSLGDGRSLVITALAGPAPGSDPRGWKEEDAPERAFLYDVPRRELRPFAALDSLTVQAARLVGGGTGQSR